MAFSTSARYLLLGSLTMLFACSEPGSPTKESSPSKPDEDVTTLQEGYVLTPAGYYHRSCVHEVANGSRVGIDGSVVRRDGTRYKIPACTFPRRSGQVTRSSNQPLTSGWLESASATLPSGNWFGKLDAGWTVPTAPTTAYTANQTYFTFPALQANNQSRILQPVLQYGASAAGGGSFWGLASWNCSTSCTHSPLITVSTGDILHGTVAASSCSGGTCTWTITGQDVSSSQQSNWTVTDTDNYLWAGGGVVEVYNLTSCGNYPATPVLYSGIQTYDKNLNPISPSWSDTVTTTPFPSPWCGFYSKHTSNTVTVGTGSTKTASGGGTATCGLCSPSVFSSVTTSGNTITLHDNGGHAFAITLNGMTATGSFTANCGLLCSNSAITAFVGSNASSITVKDNGGHIGTITLSGATAQGGISLASCGVTCSNGAITSVTASGNNYVTVLDNGSHTGYMILKP